MLQFTLFVEEYVAEFKRIFLANKAVCPKQKEVVTQIITITLNINLWEGFLKIYFNKRENRKKQVVLQIFRYPMILVSLSFERQSISFQWYSNPKSQRIYQGTSINQEKKDFSHLETNYLIYGVFCLFDCSFFLVCFYFPFSSTAGH